MDAVKAFIKAQTEMGKAIKNTANPHLRSKYADLNSVMDAAMPALNANGFGLMQPAGADERGLYVDTVLIHESGERFTSRVYLVMGKQDMQALGSAQTYARRYGLLGMAGIAPEDDDGEATKQAPRQQTARQPQAAPEREAQRAYEEASTAATDAAARLMAAATVDALKAAVEALPEPIRNDPHVQNAKAARWHQLNQKEAA